MLCVLWRVLTVCQQPLTYQMVSIYRIRQLDEASINYTNEDGDYMTLQIEPPTDQMETANRCLQTDHINCGNWELPYLLIMLSICWELDQKGKFVKIKYKWRAHLNIFKADKTVRQVKLNLAYFVRQMKLTWPGSFLAYASENYKRNLNSLE